MVVNTQTAGAQAQPRVVQTDGNLRIWGGAGTDSLTTGGGNDLLYGGGGADTFRYQATGESTASAYDTILDFQSATDKIDLDRIDANTNADGNQAFAFIGNAAFTAAGQLRAVNVSGDLWRIEGDVDGDGVADLVIQLHLTGQPLAPGDFLPQEKARTFCRRGSASGGRPGAGEGASASLHRVRSVRIIIIEIHGRIGLPIAAGFR